MANSLLTLGEYAVHRNVGPSAVSNWKKRGLIVMADDGTGRLKVDVARSDAKVNAVIDPSRGRPSKGMQAAAVEPAQEAPVEAPSQTQQVADVRVDLIREQTIGRRMTNARDAGALVPFEEFAARLGKFGRQSRERMVSIVRSNAERLAAERDPRQIVALLEAEIETAFKKLAQDARSGRDEDDTEELPPVAESGDAEANKIKDAVGSYQERAAANAVIPCGSKDPFSQRKPLQHGRRR
jgi:hypothetical protein